MDYTIIQYPALPHAYTPMAPGRRIDMIMLHATGGIKVGDLFTLSGRDRRYLVSSHYYISKIGEIYQLVQDKDVAWHAGVSYWQGEGDCNSYSIGVELENANDGSDKFPQAQLDATLWLVRNKVAQYKIPMSRLVKHAEVAVPPGRKNDPRGFPWDTFISRVYSGLDVGPPAPQAPPPPAKEILRAALMDAAYERVRSGFRPDWAMHQFAITQRLGPPLLPVFHFIAEGREWVGEAYGQDAICSPTGDWQDIRMLFKLPDGELKTVLRNEVYRQLGATYHPDWAFHQYADRNPIGVPLTESFQVTLRSGEAFAAQIYTIDTLVTPYGHWKVIFPLSDLLEAGNIHPRDAELRDLLLSRMFQRVGMRYHPEWAMHQQVVRRGIGAPITGQQVIEMGAQDYVTQSFGRDVLYSPVGDWGVVDEMVNLM